MVASQRMSAEEKRNCILRIYQSTKDVYTEKEIISLATKAGVSQGAIVQTNDELVDGNLVEKEKIGGVIYFWSFPSKVDRMAQNKLEALRESLTASETKTESSKKRLAEVQVGREDTDGVRATKLARLSELRALRATREAELEVLKENDPMVIADLQKELRMCRDAANRWTDNIFACKSYLTKKRGLDKKEAIKMIGIGSAFDYPEDKIPK